MPTITSDVIMSVVTMVVTLVLGELSKKYEWLERNYIPLQNLLVGLFSGVILFAVGLSENIITAIIICIWSAFSAGGIYDFSKTRSDKGDEC